MSSHCTGSRCDEGGLRLRGVICAVVQQQQWCETLHPLAAEQQLQPGPCAAELRRGWAQQQQQQEEEEEKENERRNHCMESRCDERDLRLLGCRHSRKSAAAAAVVAVAVGGRRLSARRRESSGIAAARSAAVVTAASAKARGSRICFDHYPQPIAVARMRWHNCPLKQVHFSATAQSANAYAGHWVEGDSSRKSSNSSA